MTLGRSSGAFVARREELSNLDRLLQEYRLVTITGPPGVGKTTLAIEFVRQSGSRFLGGVVLCDLSEAGDVDDICSVVAATIDVPVLPEDSLLQLGRALAERGRALVVLDNFEQLVVHAPAVFSAWLDAAPEARFLVTSRERLRLRGEVVLDLPPLTVPPRGRDALDLFVERVRATGRCLTLGDDDMTAIGAIVRGLDGIPLAIELAAARIGVLSPAQLLARLPGQLDILTRGPRDASARQRTLRAAIDSSWNLLEVFEQRALAQSAVFRGGFSLAAAEAVLDLPSKPQSAVLNALQALCDKSLLCAEPRHGEVRYRLYASIHEYAHEQLGRDDVELRATRARHARFFARGAAAWSEGMQRAGSAQCAQHFRLEQDNVLAAIDHGLDEASTEVRTEAFRMLAALAPLICRRGPLPVLVVRLDRALAADPGTSIHAGLLAEVHGARAEARRIQGDVEGSRVDLGIAIALAKRSDETRLEAELRGARALLEAYAGRPEIAEEEYQHALESMGTGGEPRTLGTILMNFSDLRRIQGRLAEARALGMRARTLLLESGDLRLYACALGNLASVDTNERQVGRARAYLVETIECLARLGDRRNAATAQANLALLLHDCGEIAEAIKCMEEALGSLRLIGDRRNTAAVLAYLGNFHHAAGRVEQASVHYRDALSILRQVGDQRREALVLGYFGAAAARLGETDRAAEALDAAEKLLQSSGDAVARVVVGLQRSHLDHALGHAEAMARRVAEACPLSDTSGEIRLALRVLDATGSKSPALTLVIGPDAAWFRPPGGDRVSLAHRAVLRRLLRRLVDHHRRAPGDTLSSIDLLRAGWPDDKVQLKTGAVRVRVALATLRKLGLRPFLLRRGDGWLLDPVVSIVDST